MQKTLNSPSGHAVPFIRTSSLIRGFDLIASGLGLLLLAPLLLVIGLVIKFTSPGCVFYRAERVGKDGSRFKLFKFRSMYQDADRDGPAITLKNDRRITPFGSFLRQTKLDELPQLINVFRGEMSLVGPRPEDPYYVALYTPEQAQVLAVRPGITSPASLHYHEEETLLHGDNWETVYREQIMPHKLAVDLAYLRRRTLWTDWVLILKTVGTVLRGQEYLEAVMCLRNRHIFILDMMALLLIPALALTLRLDTMAWWPAESRALGLFMLVALPVKLSIFYMLGLYSRYWRQASSNDLIQVIIAVCLSTTMLMALFMATHTRLEQYGWAIYRSVPLIDGLLTLLAVVSFRFGLRGLYSWNRRGQGGLDGRRVLVVGAGEAGTMVVRELLTNAQLNLAPVAFIDDDPAKLNAEIQGLPVLGTCLDIPRLVERYHIQQIIVAIPSAPLRRQREIMALCRQAGIVTETFPGLYEILAGYKTVSNMPRLEVSQLLRREPIVTDPASKVSQLAGMTVLVSGAGGSIGSELCRQIARSGPKEIILLGHGENSIFEINLELRLSFPELLIHPLIVDVRDQPQVNRTIKKYRPDVIFHAAAHKHVPFMEANAEEAFTNNVLGTRNVLLAAEQYGVECFVLVSTDKAVNPSSIMGVTKRIAEWLVMAVAQRSGKAYTAVRFGNVLGSRGSVLHVFQRQLAIGGPLTVTHPDMHRYFMTISEAVHLLLQAAVIGRGGEIFVLDMGQPVRILNIANDLIKLAGLKPGRDVQIVFSGIRPGEKLNEKLFFASEQYRRTENPRIFVTSHNDGLEAEAIEKIVAELASLIRHFQDKDNTERFLDILFKICYYIDSYQPRPQLLLPRSIPRSRTATPPLPLIRNLPLREFN